MLVSNSVGVSPLTNVVKAADDGVVPYTPVEIVIPFEKKWNDEGESLRPESITVNLYRFRGDSYTESDLFDTATVTAANEWKHEFRLTDSDDQEPAFYIGDDGKYHVYNFAVVEGTVPNYTEVAEEHKDPAVNMTTLDGEEDWVWIRPNSVTEFEVNTEAKEKSFIAAKKGNQLYIWTPEEISVIEQKILLALVREHP